MTDQELKDLIASLAVAQKETDKQIKENGKQLKETDKQIKETAEQLKETDKQLKETDKQIALLSKEQKETGQQLKELGRQLGGLGNKFGSFTEGMAFPAMDKILRRRFGMETVASRVKSTRGGDSLELDVLAYSNGAENAAYIVEVKSHLREDGLQQMLDILKRFPNAFPEHADKRLYGILATVDAPDDLKARVLRAGIYLALIHDETFVLQTPDDFQPRCFTEPLLA